MKVKSITRIIVILLAIILISIISFLGIYVQDKNTMKNILPEYKWGMDFAGSRRIEIQVDQSKKTVNYDADGKVIESSDTTTEVANSQEVPVNVQEDLTIENYKKAKSVFEKRLKNMQVTDYTIRLNEENGNMIIEVPENEDTDMIVSQLQSRGKFEILDDDTNEVLMNNADIASAKAGYGTTTSGTTAVFINIQFNKEGKEKFKNITNTYVETTNEATEGEEQTTTTKKIKIQLDGETILTTYFAEEISNGLLQLSVGSSTTTSVKDLQSYLLQAQNMATLLDAGKVPVVYEVEQNKFVASNITENIKNIAKYVAIGMVVIASIYCIVKYRKLGFLCSVSWIGWIGALLVILRYTNVMLTLEGIMAIVVTAGISFGFLLKLLRTLKEIDDRKLAFQRVFKQSIMAWIPLYVIAVVFTFTGWLPIFSFGMTLFWGITLCIIYHYLISRTLVIDAKQ